jgi:hypothetical protein
VDRERGSSTACGTLARRTCAPRGACPAGAPRTAVLPNRSTALRQRPAFDGSAATARERRRFRLCADRSAQRQGPKGPGDCSARRGRHRPTSSPEVRSAAAHLGRAARLRWHRDAARTRSNIPERRATGVGNTYSRPRGRAATRVPARYGAITCTSETSNAQYATRHAAPESQNPSARTRYATASRRTYSSAATTSARCKSSWVMRTCERRRSIRTS